MRSEEKKSFDLKLAHKEKVLRQGDEKYDFSDEFISDPIELHRIQELTTNLGSMTKKADDLEYRLVLAKDKIKNLEDTVKDLNLGIKDAMNSKEMDKMGFELQEMTKKADAVE